MERYVLGSREYKQTIVKDHASTDLPTGAIVDVFHVLWELALATLIFCVEFKTRIVSPFCSSSIPIPPPDTCISIINHVPSALQDGLL
jgi:hypothetical protein